MQKETDYSKIIDKLQKNSFALLAQECVKRGLDIPVENVRTYYKIAKYCDHYEMLLRIEENYPWVIEIVD